MNFKGYVSSRKLLDQTLVQQSVQNLVIREACKKRGFNYQLSATEYGMENCFLILNQITNDLNKGKFSGIAFYSIEQLPKEQKSREKIYKVAIKHKKKLLFSLEDILVENQKDVKTFENLYKIKSLLKFCPNNFKLN